MRLGISFLTLAAGLLVLGLLVFGSSAFAQQAVKVTMGTGRDASQTGTATLTPVGNQTEVVISIQSGAAGVEQAVHIHQGSCPGVGAVAFPLTNVVDGASTTMVDATLASLQTGGFSINVHQGTSPADLAVYVSCGNIPAAAPAAPAAVPATGGPPGSDGFPAAWYLLLAAGGVLAALGGGILAVRAVRAR